MFVVSKQSNCGYRGRFRQQAVELIKAGIRVGFMPMGPADVQVHCHVCNANFPKPETDPVFKDAWGECPSCHTPFIFARI